MAMAAQTTSISTLLVAATRPHDNSQRARNESAHQQASRLTATTTTTTILFALVLLHYFGAQCVQGTVVQISQQVQPVNVNTRISSVAEGPGVDLLALNKRRFELGHDHGASAAKSLDDMSRAEVLETQLASMPERIIGQLPDAVSRELLEQLANDPSLMMTLSSGTVDDPAMIFQQQQQQQLSFNNNNNNEDPDGASIERLTKSCMSIHASSARPEQLNVTFHLYTRANARAPIILRPQVTRAELLGATPFDARKPLKWITHGFHTNVDKSEWMLEAKDKILAHEDANVVLTDWRRGASPALAFYPKAAANAHVVAKMIVRILRRVRQDVDLSRVHLIGHSLGAHIMGFVGSAFTEEHLLELQRVMAARAAQLNGGSSAAAFDQAWHVSDVRNLIGRISACDPALPCFGPTSSAPAAGKQLAGGATVAVSVPTGAGPQHAHQTLTVARAHSQQLTKAAAAAAAVDVLVAEPDDWVPTMWTHLRPDSAVVVEVMHSNPGVMGYADPLGDYDFYPNGFERQPGCGVDTSTPSSRRRSIRSLTAADSNSTSRSRRQLGLIRSLLGVARRRIGGGGGGGGANNDDNNKQMVHATNGLSSTLDKFIKPIRDFLHGYTCSHHRSVDYMVESMYYEQVPQERKLDRDYVCQMVGYLCADYASFKRGFCYKCAGERDCRAFMMPLASAPDAWRQTDAMRRVETRSLHAPNNRSDADVLSHKFRTRVESVARELFNNNNSTQQTSANNASTRYVAKRVLPTLNHRAQDYRAPKRNKYYLDTSSRRSFCVHHYHLLVKYKWWRVRDNVNVDGLRLSGTLGNMTLLHGEPSPLRRMQQEQQQQQQQQQSYGKQQQQEGEQQQQNAVTFNRHTLQTYTMLLTHTNFLGQIESLALYGEHLRPTLIEYIEVTYMSNLDARVRALGSARLCRASTTATTTPAASPSWLINAQLLRAGSANTHLFVRCSGVMV